MHYSTALSALALTSASVALAQAPPPAGFPGTPPPSPPAIIRELTAEPAAIQPGGSTTLRWEALNAYSLTLEPGVGSVATRGAHRVQPLATTTNTLTATGPKGATTRAVTVTVAGTTPVARAASDEEQRTSIPRLADGKPDLSGLYQADRNLRLVAGVTLVPGAESFRVAAATERDAGTGDDCLPPGVPAATMLPFPLQILQTRDTLAIMYEAYHQFRIVPIGREQAEYLAPAWMGHSVARWDGDTLVVDVRGFNDRTVVAGHRHTEDLRVTERYRRTSYETIEYSAQVEDPNVFATPLRYEGTLTLHPEWEIGEYVCTENNQDYDELFENK
ncbi:MAG TPA: hypothetical protein VM692_15320 [Gammaproteobacteria bacterium]|nr:hypothetical protein [Gammaproteobacteria bacterium]